MSCTLAESDPFRPNYFLSFCCVVRALSLQLTAFFRHMDFLFGPSEEQKWINNATQEVQRDVDWAKNLTICDQINAAHDGSVATRFVDLMCGDALVSGCDVESAQLLLTT